MANAIPLDVYVNDSRVGVLSENQEGLFVFTYLPGIPADQLVSLTMPVRPESYKWGRGGLHPYFCMNLPEGTKKDLVRQQLGSAAQVTDIGLLALTGQRTIGRVRCVPQGQPPTLADDKLQVATLLASPDARELLLQHLVNGLNEGVSGVMPKLLREDKTTTATQDYIVKTGHLDLPGLSINEYLCLLAARRAGLAACRTFRKVTSDVKTASYKECMIRRAGKSMQFVYFRVIYAQKPDQPICNVRKILQNLH